MITRLYIKGKKVVREDLSPQRIQMILDFHHIEKTDDEERVTLAIDGQQGPNVTYLFNKWSFR